MLLKSIRICPSGAELCLNLEDGYGPKKRRRFGGWCWSRAVGRIDAVKWPELGTRFSAGAGCGSDRLANFRYPQKGNDPESWHPVSRPDGTSVEQNRKMKKVSIINFKGGVGKTTLSLHLAAYLARQEKSVLLIDVDHQSSLSIAILGEFWQECVEANRTVDRVFQSFCNPRKVTMPKSEIVIKNAFGKRGQYRDAKDLYPTLDLVSAQFELDDTEIDLASTTSGSANRSDWEKRTLLAEWLDAIDAQRHYHYVVFDCPPATKIVSQNALAASDSYIIPVIPDEASARGVTHFRNLVQNKIDSKLANLKTSANVAVKDVPKNFAPTTNLAGIVPYLAKQSPNARSGLTNIHTEQIAALRKKWGDDVTEAIGKNYIGVPEAGNAGLPVWNWSSNNVKLRVERMMTAICEELQTRIDQ